MPCGAIGKQKYTDPTLLEPTKAGKFEAVAITFKMDAKKNGQMSMSKRNVRWPALRSVLGPILPILSCFLSLRSFYFYARTGWDLMWQMSLRIENSRNLAHFTVVASMQRARVLNAWEPFNGPISRVNLPLFTFIVRNCKDKISETFIVRSWTWVF